MERLDREAREIADAQRRMKVPSLSARCATARCVDARVRCGAALRMFAFGRGAAACDCETA